MTFTVVIPARHASTRLPGKMLSDLGGKPLIVRTAEQALLSSATEVIVATDHEDIAEAVRKVTSQSPVDSGWTPQAVPKGFNDRPKRSLNNIRSVMTRVDHASGTDRLAEVALKQGWADDAVVVNVQGDEPFIAPRLIDAVAAALIAAPDAAIATAAKPILAAEDFFNPNVVKVVCDARGLARYFSRAPIPWARDAFAQSRDTLPSGIPALHHIGIYAYRAGFLKQFASLAPSPLEQMEALEQLRALHHGFGIAVTVWNEPIEAGIDTPADLARAQAHFG